MQLEAKSFGKVNLFLNIVGKNNNNYHLLESFFTMLSVYDTITISPADKITCEVNNGRIISDNIIIKAALSLQQASKSLLGANIKLTKNIPIGAGLGGGSSNAATTLLLLNKLWGLNYSKDKLAKIALTIGADVPFFIYGHNALVRGIGENITPTKLEKKIYLLLVNPRIPVSTKEVFQNNKHSFSPPLLNTESNKILDLIFNGTNILQSSAVSICPIIDEIIKTILKEEGCINARMTGSGSTCFGIFKNIESLELAKFNFQKLYPKFWIQSEMLQL